MWDTLSTRERWIVSNDPDSELAKWFNKTVMAEAKAKYESPTYWMNEQSSFMYSQWTEREAQPLPFVPVVLPDVVPDPEPPAPAPKKRKARKSKKTAPELAEAA